MLKAVKLVLRYCYHKWLELVNKFSETQVKENVKINTQNEVKTHKKEEKKMSKIVLKTKVVCGHTVEYFDLNGERWYSQRCMTTISISERLYPGATKLRPVVLSRHDVKMFSDNKRSYKGLVFISEHDLRIYIRNRNDIAKDHVSGAHKKKGCSGWSSFTVAFIKALFKLSVVENKISTFKASLAREGSEARKLEDLYRGSLRMQEAYKQRTLARKAAKTIHTSSHKQLLLFQDYCLTEGSK